MAPARTVALGAVLWGWALPLAVSVVLVAEGVLDTWSSDVNTFPYVVLGRDLATAALAWMAVAAAVAVWRTLRAPSPDGPTERPQTGGSGR